ncbi:protein wings apart-like [Pollicipes pollicipes]|uniref:protein wings apart-like n=1 Tax=Pollicipes pollicipes TaxID=41117 RepID=UPI0018856D05|nr:protein wings apart-like [Pollicipes pollicipes]
MVFMHSAPARSALDFAEEEPGAAAGPGPLSGRLTRVSTWHGADPNDTGEHVTSVKCHRSAKEYYTVIQNVKKAYQIQEFGEFQEYNDDIEYIMDALQPTNSVSTRCLSATRLAGKCMAAAFRMHLRAHGTVTRFFAALADAPSDPSLSLCTSAVMFILSEDQLNMDLDKSSLELMLSLLDSDATAPSPESAESNGELCKNRAKVRELCAQLQRQGQAKQLNLDTITAGHLSMETLLSLTSQRAGAWFKEELRALGGVDRLMGTVSDSLRCLRQTDELRRQRDTIARVSRCLRVVENVTSRNEENQRHVLQCGGGAGLATLSELFQLAERELADPACSAAILHAVLRLPDRLPEHRQFDLLLLSMYLLMNVTESSAENRRRLVTRLPPLKLRISRDKDTGDLTARC